MSSCRRPPRLKRNDMVSTPRDGFLLANKRALAPIGEARSDHAIFATVAERLGFAERFTEGRDEMGWLRHLYGVSQRRAAERGVRMPEFDEFWKAGLFELPAPKPAQPFLAAFRADPQVHPLTTPSGKIELWSARIASYGYDDCPPHPVWLEPAEWLGSERAKRYPLHLVSNQPATRLHSQLDQGVVSQEAKVAGREPIWIHPDDAARRGNPRWDGGPGFQTTAVSVWPGRWSRPGSSCRSSSWQPEPGTILWSPGCRERWRSTATPMC